MRAVPQLYDLPEAKVDDFSNSPREMNFLRVLYFGIHWILSFSIFVEMRLGKTYSSAYVH